MCSTHSVRDMRGLMCPVILYTNLIQITLQLADLWFQRKAHAATPQLLLDHPVGQLELCPGIELVDGGVGKDGDVRDMTLTIIVDRVW